jgi:hypothetical protein
VTSTAFSCKILFFNNCEIYILISQIESDLSLCPSTIFCLTDCWVFCSPISQHSNDCRRAVSLILTLRSLLLLYRLCKGSPRLINHDVKCLGTESKLQIKNRDGEMQQPKRAIGCKTVWLVTKENMKHDIQTLRMKRDYQKERIATATWKWVAITEIPLAVVPFLNDDDNSWLILLSLLIKAMKTTRDHLIL